MILPSHVREWLLTKKVVNVFIPEGSSETGKIPYADLNINYKKF